MASSEKVLTKSIAMEKDAGDPSTLHEQDSFVVVDGGQHSIEENQLLRKIDRWLVLYLPLYSALELMTIMQDHALVDDFIPTSVS